MPNLSTRQEITELDALIDDLAGRIAQAERRAEELLERGGSEQELRNAAATLETLRDVGARLGDILQTSTSARNKFVGALYRHAPCMGIGALADMAGHTTSYVSRVAGMFGIPRRTVRHPSTAAAPRTGAGSRP